ncbi:hypothetical protein B0H19DRAFT_1266617 [Mycena capillaripes]|nr:hypothetical protein B0H19DRAFT_1266617 [Mycena capillaripes]
MENAPTSTIVPRQWQLDADFAYLSIIALGAMGHLIDAPRYESQSDAARVGSDSAQERSMFLDPIVKLFYVFLGFSKFNRAMVGTAGCIELTTKLDVLADVKSVTLPTAALGSLGIHRIVAEGRSKSNNKQYLDDVEFSFFFITWKGTMLVHAIKAGFFAAFPDCSPILGFMPAEYIKGALHVMREVLPIYLPHCSFIEVVQTGG